MAFIDSKMAELQHGVASPEPPMDDTIAHSSSISKTKASIGTERQPAGVGKIQEVDLGPDAALRNIALTERATRLLNGEPDIEPASTQPTKVRLGPDGKPWRGRRRRNSDDIRRDKLVEEVLRESKGRSPPSSIRFTYTNNVYSGIL